MNVDPMKSAQPCGCDPGAGHMCNYHVGMKPAIESYYGIQCVGGALPQPANARHEGSGYMVSDSPLQAPQTAQEHYATSAGYVTDTNEVRVTDPDTGGQKGSKLARFDLIPPQALWGLAEVYGRGARKYADRNWERGYAWGLSMAALERHYNAFKSRESIDSDTGAHHMLQVAWHAFALYTFERFELGTDDRSELKKNWKEEVAPTGEQHHFCPQREAVCTLCGDQGYALCCTLAKQTECRRQEEAAKKKAMQQQAMDRPAPFTCPVDDEENCCPGSEASHRICIGTAARNAAAKSASVR